MENTGCYLGVSEFGICIPRIIFRLSRITFLATKNCKTNIRRTERKPRYAIEKGKITDLEKAVELLMGSVKENNYIPYQLLQKKKKKTRRSLHL